MNVRPVPGATVYIEGTRRLLVGSTKVVPSPYYTRLLLDGSIVEVIEAKATRETRTKAEE